MKGWFSSVKNFVASVVEENDVVDLRGNWLKVRDYFETVQKTTDESKLKTLKTRLPVIEDHLNRMIDVLLAEKEKFVVRMCEDAPDLPPCYQYLLRKDASALSASTVGSVPFTPEEAFSSENDFVIFNICQYAKHDQPEGARSVVLRFLYRALTEVDARDGSMLSLCHDYITMPLCDALLKISNSFDVQRLASTPGSSPVPKQAKVAITLPRTTPEDKIHYVALLRCICEKVEQFPELMSIFTLPVQGKGPTLLLLDQLALYVHDDLLLQLPPSERLTTQANALRGILALARCGNPHLQDLVAARTDIGTSILEALRTNFLTVCKVPQNAELRLQVAYILEALRWMEAVTIVAPAVADAWSLLAKFRNSFLRHSVLPLFRIPDDRSYVAVTTILTHVLKDALTAGSMFANCIGESLLQSRVDRQHYHIYCLHEEFPSDFEESTTRFDETFLWPRFKDSSDHVVQSTMQCLAALCLRAPHVVMLHCMGLDAHRRPLHFSRSFLQSALMDRDQRLNRLTSHDSDARPQSSATVLKVSPLVPEINVSEYFPRSIIVERGLCGTSLDSFAEDVLKIILEAEAALSESEFRDHRVRIEKVGKDLNTTAVVTDSSRSNGSYCAGANAEFADNVFFCSSVDDSPMIQAVVNVLSTMLDHPCSVNAVLTELITTLCCLPDLRVPFTLLDRRSRMAKCLTQVAGLVEATFAREQQQAEGVQSADGITRRALFFRFAERPFFDPSDDLSTFGDERVARLMRSSQVFVEACLCLEGFRQELAAVICYHVMSQSMTELQGSMQR